MLYATFKTQDVHGGEQRYADQGLHPAAFLYAVLDGQIELFQYKNLLFHIANEKRGILIFHRQQRDAKHVPQESFSPG